MSPSPSGKLLAIAAVFATTVVPFMTVQDKREESCGGLHAAIRENLFGATHLHATAIVMLTFILLNDSEAQLMP